MSKRICIVIPNYITRLIGGAELQAYLLAEELFSRNWEVEIISSISKVSDKINNPQYINPKFKYHYFKQTPIIVFSFFAVLWLLLKSKANIYYVRTDYPHVGAVGFYCWLTRKKCIYACADNECFYRNRYSRAFNPKEYNNFIKRSIRKIDLYLVDKFIEFGKKIAHYVIAQTSEQQEKMLRTFGKNSVIIRNSFKKNNLPVTFKENIVLWVGNLRKIKQPELFIQLYQTTKLSGFKFVLIGEKNAEYANFPGINDPNFVYLGKLGLEETEQWIARSKFIVNTSVSEGFSNTFIQAWFYKTYVLSLNADPENLFSNAKLGYYANGSISNLATALTEMISGSEQISITTDKAFKYALNEFDLSVNASKFEKMLLHYN